MILKQGEGMKRKDHASFCSEIDSLSLPPKKEQAMEKQESKQLKATKRERERERTFFLFHHLFSYSAVSLTCLPLAKRYIYISLSLSVFLSLSLAHSPLLQGRGIYVQGMREQERRNTLDRLEVPPTIVSLTSQLGTQSPGSLHCLRPCDNASRRIHQVASDLGSPLTKGNNDRHHLQAVEPPVFKPKGAGGWLKCLAHVAIKNKAMPMHVRPGPHSAIMKSCSLHMASSAIKI
jgi:hypothetical protein